MKKLKKKNMKWWVGVISCMILFFGIGIFTYSKMGFLIKGVEVAAHIERADTSPLVEVKGKAENAIYVSLNGREIYIDKDGSFTERVSLLPGLSVVTIDAQDKFGKSSEKKFEVMYQKNTGAVALGDVIINTN